MLLQTARVFTLKLQTLELFKWANQQNGDKEVERFLHEATQMYTTVLKLKLDGLLAVLKYSLIDLIT